MTIEITKSFDKKIQIKQFEPVSFFCSMHATCELDKAEEVGKMLFEECKKQVLADELEILKEYFPDRFKTGDIDTAKVADVAKETAELDIPDLFLNDEN